MGQITGPVNNYVKKAREIQTLKIYKSINPTFFLQPKPLLHVRGSKGPGLPCPNCQGCYLRPRTALPPAIIKTIYRIAARSHADCCFVCLSPCQLA